VSAALAELLRKSTSTYNDRWVAQSASNFNTTPRPEMVAQHHQWWAAIVHAVETSEFEELLEYGREAGRFQSRQGYDLSDAVRRTVEATNLIELALLETAGDLPSMDIATELATLRSMLVMAVAEGYTQDQNARIERRTPDVIAVEKLRDLILRQSTPRNTVALVSGGEIPPLYDAGMLFHFIDYGKLRLYNLLPNGRAITLSILGPGDVFLQWRAGSQSLSCLCGEAMQPSRIVTVDQETIAGVVAQQPMAALDIMTNFARRLTESQVLIEDLMNNSINLRLYRTLLELLKQFGRDDKGATLIDYPLTHQRLADMIGSNRVTVTRKLTELQTRGIIESRKGATIAVRRVDALQALANAGALE